MKLGLSGKTALLFGASQGIGAAAARALTAEGVTVAITGRAAPQTLAAELGGLALSADLTCPGDAERATAAAAKAFGRIDIAVVSAGAAQGGVFWTLGDEVWEDALALKFMGLVRAVRAVTPLMREQRGGRIVGVVGNLGRQPDKRLLPGSAANAACLAFLQGAADELSADGVKVLAINPGPTRTQRWTRLIDQLAAAERRPREDVEADRLKMMASGRIAEPEEIGRLIAVLASDLAEHMTGTSLTVDGGMTRGIG